MTNVIKLDEVSYFPYDEFADMPDWEHSFDIYIRLKSQNKAFEFHVGRHEAVSVNRQFADARLNFITFSTDFGSTHVINKKYIKWLSINAESSPDYPEILLSDDGEVEARYSRICKVDFTQDNVLWMLPTVTEDEDQRVYSDFSFLHSLGTRLTVKVSRAITQFRELKADGYYLHLEDDDESGYRSKFFQSWGCRIYLNDASEYFQPGISEPEIIGGIFKGQALNNSDAEGFFLRLRNSEDNTHFIPMKDIAMLECPTVFLGIDTFMRLHGKHRSNQATENPKINECRRLARI